MDKLVIYGKKRLNGELFVSSAKNSILPIIACSIMSKEDIIIHNCPDITDMRNMLNIIISIGGETSYQDGVITINCRNASPHLIESNLTNKLRSSIFILGAILARFHMATVSYPGGCEIGLRPIDLHLHGLRCLNIDISENGGLIQCDGRNLTGGDVNLDFPSVGATENIMMAATLAKGRTIIRNAAREPEIVDLQNFINFLGGRIYGAGSSRVVVEGVSELKGGEYTPISDRIVAGTYLTACAMCGGKLTLHNVNYENMFSTIDVLRRCGNELTVNGNEISMVSAGRLNSIHKLETQPFPGFPTDMQAQITAMLCLAEGSSVIVENLFESRYKHTQQLVKMGANITVKDRIAMIRGVKTLYGANVSAEDLRGGAALILAGLAAEGKTTIENIHHIKRGYNNIDKTFAELGAEIVTSNFDE